MMGVLVVLGLVAWVVRIVVKAFLNSPLYARMNEWLNDHLESKG